MKEICLLTGAISTLSASVEGDEISPDIVVWKSSQPTVAAVDAKGTVTALKVGTAEITASAFDSNAKCTVTVLQPGNSSIGGTVNNSGSGNVRVNLYVNTNDPGLTKRGIIGGYVLLASTIPNDNGEYCFDNLPEGSYQVEVVIEDIDPEATEALALSDNETLTDIDFIVDEEEGRIIVVGETDPDPDPDPEPELPTDTKDIFDTCLMIYPNPFTDAVRITVENDRTTSARIQVFNTAGVIVHTQTIASPDEIIHLRHLPAGMYILRLENGKNAKTVKMIKIQ